MSLNNEFDPIGGDGVPASPDAVPQEASPRIIITAQPIKWEPHPSGQQWTESRYGYCITLESEDLPETPYVATLGEGDPETFATLAEAQAWCQRDIDATVARWAVVAAPPPQAAHNPCKLAECQGKPRCSMCLTADERRHERAAPKAGAGDVDAMARVLFDAWAKAEPEHSITKNPVSYMTTFCDMARAALAAPAERVAQPLTDEQIAALTIMLDHFAGDPRTAYLRPLVYSIGGTEGGDP